MSEDHKRQLEQQLWNIANTLRGKMNADEFRDYILGFIFYKYLSEKMNRYADEILVPDGIKYVDVDEHTESGQEYLEAIRDEALEKLGYFLKPTELFSQMTEQHINYMLSKIPMNRFGEVGEVAEMVAWLASSHCTFATGAVFDLSGGRATY